MNKKSTLYPINTLLIIINIAILQLSMADAQSFKKEVKNGDKAFERGSYSAAAAYYTKAENYIKSPTKKHLFFYYKLGFCDMYIKEFKKASENYNRYLTLAKTTKVNERELKQVNEWKIYCESELERLPESYLKKFEDKYKITNLSTVNSFMNDYGAIMSYDNSTLIFSSNRKTADIKSLSNLNDDLYLSTTEDGNFNDPVRMMSSVSDYSDESFPTVTGDNERLYIAVNISGNSNIYQLSRKGYSWGNPVPLSSTINTSAFEGYPSISKDGKTLYFVSDREGGFGGMDIWYSKMQNDGSWSDPQNMGTGINTKLDEISPFIDSTGRKLYFSSKGQFGMGGFDIFYSTFEATGMWTRAVNMGEPINSAQDDICYAPMPVTGQALFSSNRPAGTGIYDIYLLEYVKEKRPSPFADAITQAPPDTTKTLKEPAMPPAEVVSETNDLIINGKPLNTEMYQAAITALPYYDPVLFNAKVAGLYYRVQLGAFRNQIGKSNPYFTKKLNPKDLNEELSPDQLYKYTIGKYSTIKGATELKLVLRDNGYSDAFLTCYLNDVRISMDEAKSTIRKKSVAVK